MDRQQIALKLTLDCLSMPAKVTSFEDRLVLQKSVYLCQAAGVDLGYYFRWYLRGPYCSALAADGYSVSVDLAQGNDESSNWTLDAKSRTNLDQVNSLLEAEDPRAPWLELLASVHFLVDRNQVSTESADEISETLQGFGKDFTLNQVRKALRELREHGLLSEPE